MYITQCQILVSPGVGGVQLTVACLINRNCASRFITEIIYIDQLQFYTRSQHITRVCYSSPHHMVFTVCARHAQCRDIVKGVGTAGPRGRRSLCNVETTAAKVSLCPRNISDVMRTLFTKFSSSQSLNSLDP